MGLPGQLGDKGVDARPDGGVVDAAIGLEDDEHGVARLLREPVLQQVEGGDGVGPGQVGALCVAAVESVAEDAEGDEGDDPENENEAAAVEAPAGETFEHRRACPLFCRLSGVRPQE